MSLKELQYSGDHSSGILHVSYTLVFLLDQELSSPHCHEVIDHPSPQGREHGEETEDRPEYPSLEKQHTVEELGGKALWRLGWTDNVCPLSRWDWRSLEILAVLLLASALDMRSSVFKSPAVTFTSPQTLLILLPFASSPVVLICFLWFSERQSLSSSPILLQSFKSENK